MKKFLSFMLCLSMLIIAAGCSPKEQSATYELVETEDGLYVLTDTQTLYAKGDKVYEILETTSIDFKALDEETRTLMSAYYDETVAAMQASAPTGAEVTASYEDGIYILNMHLNLDEGNIQELVASGFLMGADEGDDMEGVTFISFKQTCEGLEASGYTRK